MAREIKTAEETLAQFARIEATPDSSFSRSLAWLSREENRAELRDRAGEFILVINSFNNWMGTKHTYTLPPEFQYIGETLERVLRGHVLPSPGRILNDLRLQDKHITSSWQSAFNGGEQYAICLPFEPTTEATPAVVGLLVTYADCVGSQIYGQDGLRERDAFASTFCLAFMEMLVSSRPKGKLTQDLAGWMLQSIDSFDPQFHPKIRELVAKH